MQINEIPFAIFFEGTAGTDLASGALALQSMESA
jgi:hypothetical protein